MNIIQYHKEKQSLIYNDDDKLLKSEFQSDHVVSACGLKSCPNFMNINIFLLH